MRFSIPDINLNWLRHGAVAMILVITTVGFFSPHALAQPAPVLTVGGQTGSIVLVFGAPYEFAGTGMTPSTSSQRHGYTGPDCVTHSYLTGAFADAQGEYSITLQFFTPGTISLRLEDPVLGNSNCVTVTLVEPTPTESPNPTSTESPEATATTPATETIEATTTATEDALTPTPTESCNVMTDGTLAFAQDVSCETAVASPEPVDPTATVPPVIELPSTGTGGDGSGAMYAMLLLASVAMIVIASIKWKRSAR